MLLSVSQGDCWPPSISGKRTFPVPVHPASRPFLRFLLHDTVLPVTGSVLWPLHGSAGLPLGHGSCFSYTPFSGYPYASIPRHMAGPVFGIVIHPRSSNLIPSQVVQCLWVVFVSTSFRASPSVDRISRRQSAPPYLCLAPSLPRACGCRF